MTWSTSGLSLSCKDVLTSRGPWPLDTSTPHTSGCSLEHAQTWGMRQSPSFKTLQLALEVRVRRSDHKRAVWTQMCLTKPSTKNLMNTSEFSWLASVKRLWQVLKCHTWCKYKVQSYILFHIFNTYVGEAKTQFVLKWIKTQIFQLHYSFLWM